MAYARFRLIGNCIANEIQTFAKIIYVDSQLNFTKQLMDHLPNPNPLNYSTPFKSDPIVNIPNLCILYKHISFIWYHLSFKVLNGPKINRTNEKTIALAELETAQNCLKDDEKCMEFVNLRNLVPDRTIHLNFSVVMVDNPPVHFQGKISPSFSNAEITQIRILNFQLVETLRLSHILIILLVERQRFHS